MRLFLFPIENRQHSATEETLVHTVIGRCHRPVYELHLLP